jgi:hypothetical protein
LKYGTWVGTRGVSLLRGLRDQFGTSVSSKQFLARLILRKYMLRGVTKRLVASRQYLRFQSSQHRSMASHKSVKELLGRYVPVRLAPDVSSLSVGDRAALKELVLASQIVDKLYLQVCYSLALVLNILIDAL